MFMLYFDWLMFTGFLLIILHCLISVTLLSPFAFGFSVYFDSAIFDRFHHGNFTG